MGNPLPISCLALLLIIAGIYFIMVANPLNVEPKNWWDEVKKSLFGLGMLCLGIYTILH